MNCYNAMLFCFMLTERGVNEKPTFRTLKKVHHQCHLLILRTNFSSNRHIQYNRDYGNINGSPLLYLNIKKTFVSHD